MKSLILVFIFLSLNSCSNNSKKAELWTAIKPRPTGIVINFYSRKNPFGEFSNFALFPIMVDEKLWGTSEHYYQAHKYDVKDLQEYVRKASSPEEAAKRGRQKDLPKRKNWKQVKDQIMYKALVAKYTQHENLKQLLLSTGNAPIVEHTKRDKYWGDAGDGSGLNKLGKMLVDIREKIKAGHL